MFDETFFQTSLPEHIKAKSAESVDQPSVHVKLRNGQESDFSVVLFRSNFVLFSEQNHVKALKNQWLLAMP